MPKRKHLFYRGDVVWYAGSIHESNIVYSYDPKNDFLIFLKPVVTLSGVNYTVPKVTSNGGTDGPCCSEASKCVLKIGHLPNPQFMKGVKVS